MFMFMLLKRTDVLTVLIKIRKNKNKNRKELTQGRKMHTHVRNHVQLSILQYLSMSENIEILLG